MVRGMLESLSPDTCAALAQIVPVFLIALIAERLTTPKFSEADDMVRRLGMILRFAFRAIVDIVLAIAMVAVELRCVLGIERDGLDGDTARQTWALFVVIVIWSLLRWLARNPLIVVAMGLYWRLAGLLADLFIRAVEMLIRGTIGFLGLTTTGVEKFTDWMINAITRLSDWLYRLPR